MFLQTNLKNRTIFEYFQDFCQNLSLCCGIYVYKRPYFTERKTLNLQCNAKKLKVKFLLGVFAKATLNSTNFWLFSNILSNFSLIS